MFKEWAQSYVRFPPRKRTFVGIRNLMCGNTERVFAEPHWIKAGLYAQCWKSAIEIFPVARYHAIAKYSLSALSQILSPKFFGTASHHVYS